MAPPVEYEKLLEIGVVTEARSSSGSINQFMQNAQEFAAAAKAGLEVVPRVTLAYEGTLDVAMAVLEFRGVVRSIPVDARLWPSTAWRLTSA